MVECCESMYFFFYDKWDLQIIAESEVGGISSKVHWLLSARLRINYFELFLCLMVSCNPKPADAG
jgi:hypothetical protein